MRQLSEPDPACRDAINLLAAGSLGGIVLAQLRRRCHGDEDLASDLAQETWRRIWKARGTWQANSGGAAIGFVLAVAHNCYLSHVRSDFRRVNRESEAARESAGRDALPSYSVDDLMDLHAALKRLDAPDRELLELAYFRDASDEALAAHLGLTKEAAKKRRQAALSRLRATFVHPSDREP
ncbi:MAG: sigma-70 family RNA polymerase sigma factor [Gemmatimonadetes bacterium]|nr:sigma-70 family RNA polymerase sigma factor [Gemmatimonadota bacterium]